MLFDIDKLMLDLRNIFKGVRYNSWLTLRYQTESRKQNAVHRNPPSGTKHEALKLTPLAGYQAGGRRSRHTCGYPVILTVKDLYLWLDTKQGGGAAATPAGIQLYWPQEIIPLAGYQAGGRRSRHTCGYPAIFTGRNQPRRASLGQARSVCTGLVFFNQQFMDPIDIQSKGPS